MSRLTLRHFNPFRFVGRWKKQPTSEPLYGSQLEKLSTDEWQAALTKSPEEAARWVYASATHGNIDAQMHWAQMQLDGYGTRRDSEAAFRWFGIAALSKRPDAINMLGRCHQRGWGTPVDYEKAVDCYRQAAETSFDWALFNLGSLLLEGKGAARDPDKAFQLFTKAASQGHMKSLNMVGRCYEHGWGCPQDMHEAVRWYRRSAEDGDFRGQYRYGQLLFEHGQIDDALPWLRRAVENTPVDLCGDVADALLNDPEPLLRDIGMLARTRASSP